MKKTDFNSLIENIKEDLNKCNNKELEKIFSAIKLCLKSFDRDFIMKNVKDFFKSFFKSKKDKCLFFIEDIVDSKDKLSCEEKECLRRNLLEISNIERTFLEDLKALLEAL